MARQIDARGIWRGDSKALDQFALAWAIDCMGQDSRFLRAYGWTQEALDKALYMAGDTSRGEPLEPALLWSDQA